MTTQTEKSELENLHDLKSIEPPQWLTPNASLSATARSASKEIFSLLKPHVAKSPFDELLIKGFDAEQIWQQIDLQSGPLVGLLKREIKRFEKNPHEIKKIFGNRKKVDHRETKVREEFSEEEQEETDNDEEENKNEDKGEDGESEDKGEDGDSEDEEEDGESEDEEEGGEVGGVEDKFLKIKELEEYLEDDEEREYGVKGTKKKKSKNVLEDDEEDEEDDEDEESEEDGELEEFGLDDGGSEDFENARYEDFFGSNKKKAVKRKSDLIDGSEDSETDEEQEGDATIEDKSQKNDTLSTHEKEQLKIRSKIEELEKANLEGKHWTMQGEVTAGMRPKNSLLEVDLDFEHNVRPPPVITEEITASLEELIQKRILEGRFDDVRKAPSLPSKAPKEFKELDDNKSKKGLAEIYEEEYVQKTNQDYVPTTFSDELQKEASMLFKRLCVKLDALSHFHFTPKPVIEDMSIQSNVPALAMEEVAPIAVSDAAMLAPEEVFSGKGDIKEEAELTQEERKRRRSNKKRKFKAEAAKRTTKKSRNDTTSQNANG